MPKNPQGRLELTWMGKDLALIPHKDGAYDYAWVEPNDPRVTEVRSLQTTGMVGATEAAYGEDGQMIAAGADDNLLVIGDSGDALRSLGTIPEYADRYRGQVKLVYIDPPFNTGQTFDHYSDQMEHSVWLTFMRDRIRSIKPLLAPDASIWVHLDDAEVHRMRVLLDEEFGVENFIGDVQWQRSYSPRNDAKGLSLITDTILAYQNSSEWAPNRLSRTEFSNRRFASRDGDPDQWYDGDSSAPGARTHQGMVYAIQNPISGQLIYPTNGRHWALGQDKMIEVMSEWAPYELRDIEDSARRAEICGLPETDVRSGVKAIVLAVPREEAAQIASKRYRAGNWPEFYLTGRGGSGGIRRKKRSGAIKEGRTPTNLWTWSEVGHNDSAKKEISALFPGQAAFSTPKPERLLERVLHIGSSPGDVVLDCFAGSGTTAAVAQKMGRRWVTVELLDSTVDTFITPRLSKVIDGTDMGGISTHTERVAADDVELPDGMTPTQAQAFNSALTKVASEVTLDVDVASETAKLARAAKKAGSSKLSDDELATLARLAAKLAKTSGATVDVSKQALAPLRATTKTRNEKTIRWSGGGGFTIARLGPSMYEVEDGPDGRTEVFLSPAATNGAWAAAIAGQLGYRSTPDHPVFAGCKGRERLAVVDGVADELVIRDLHAHLAAGETVLVVAKAALDDVGPLLRDLAPGSTVRVAPGGLLQKGSALR